MPQQSQRKTLPPAKKLLQLKVVLRYIQPSIWRRIVVPDNLSLGRLGYVIEIAMGWEGDHLHSFRIGKVSYAAGDANEDFGFGLGEKQRAPHEDDVQLGQLFRRKGQRALYLYDFGDSWLHDILVEKITPATEAPSPPICLAGQRAAPPEDCGSYPGYDDILRVLKRAKTADDRALRNWVGDYDPENFDLDAVNRFLRSA